LRYLKWGPSEGGTNRRRDVYLAFSTYRSSGPRDTANPSIFYYAIVMRSVL
jgi:hypothetical protein